MPTLELAPPAAVRAACARALVLAAALAPEHALSADTLSWAGKLAEGELATPERIRALKAWHTRHGMSARRAKEGRDAALYAAHGGDEGRKWAERVVRQMALDPTSVHVPGPIGEHEKKDDSMSSEATTTAKAMPHETLAIVDGDWDADAAIGRLREWSGVDAEVPSASARKKYARGFAIVENKGDKLGDYKYPFCDIRNGKLVAVAKGVSSAIAALNGARGGGSGLSESEKASALANLHKHQERWQEQQKKAATARAQSMRAKAFELSSTRLAANDLPEPGERDEDGYLCRSVVQVAKVGTYKGHPAGDFEFNSDVFDQMVANHEANPNGMVPFDYEHGSEAMGTSVYQDGAPAVGWILSLENRGEEGLFATVGWVDEECVGYIRTSRYKFVSPAVVFDATDAESGESIGPVLVSAAVTNRPFLQGMRPLTARADGGAVGTDSEDREMTREELTAALAALRADSRPIQLSADEMSKRDVLIERLRNIFRLPEMSPEADVLGALDRLDELLGVAEGERDGIDVGQIVDSLRWCFNLPLLTSGTDVIAYIRKGLAATTTEPAGEPATTSARAKTGGQINASQESPVMEKTAEHNALEAEHKDLKAKHEALSAKHAAFKGAICKTMALDPESEESTIIDALEKKVADLDRVQKQEAEAEKASARFDVDAVAASMCVTDEAGKTALLQLRTTNKAAFRATFGAILQSAKKTLDADAAAKAAA
ncbi:MAG TPA: phage protease, partial [Kofleriaceae bacterium]|nr:phage protease [Kofleriaceae bacterium]